MNTEKRPKKRAKVVYKRERQRAPSWPRVPWETAEPVLMRVFDAWAAEVKTDSGKPLTRMGFAKTTGVSYQAFYSMLKSKRGPVLARLRRMALDMGISFTDLAGLIEAADPEHKEVLQ